MVFEKKKHSKLSYWLPWKPEFLMEFNVFNKFEKKQPKDYCHGNKNFQWNLIPLSILFSILFSLRQQIRQTGKDCANGSKVRASKAPFYSQHVSYLKA